MNLILFDLFIFNSFFIQLQVVMFPNVVQVMDFGWDKLLMALLRSYASILEFALFFELFASD
jgi:hypothetical protein